MSADLFDLRAKVTVEAHCALAAISKARGIDSSELAREIMHQWAMEQINVAQHILGAFPGLTPIAVDVPATAAFKREPVTRSVRLQVFDRDGGACTYCGCVLQVSGKWHVDHVVAVSSGGTSDPGNLALSCAPCNLKKSSGSPDRLKIA